MQDLEKLGAKSIVLTGVTFNNDTTGVMVRQNGKSEYYKHVKYEKGCHGTGDVYASSFVGSLMNGLSIYDSAKVAADYVLKCIEATAGDESHWYGVKFESQLPFLLKELKLS